MVTLNHFVDKIYCINLLDDELRLRLSRASFYNHSLNVEFFHPVRMGFARQIGLSVGGFNEGQECGEVGCAISHYTVIKSALIKGCNRIAVFEDDLMFHKAFESEVVRAYYQLPSDWDAAMLYSFCPQFNGMVLDNPYWNKARQCWSSCATIMNRTFMEAYVDAMDRSFQIADKVLYDLQKTLNVYVLKKPLVLPRPNIPSNIRESPNYNDSYKGINFIDYD